MNYSNIRIAGKSYTIHSFSPKTTEKVIKSLRGFEVQKLKDIPQGNQILISTIATAISGSGILSRFKAFFYSSTINQSSKYRRFNRSDGKISGNDTGKRVLPYLRIN